MRVSVDDSTSASNRKALMGKVKRIGKELEALGEELKREVRERNTERNIQYPT